MRLEDITPEVTLSGIIPNGLAAVEAVKWYGAEALEIIYKAPSGRTGNDIYYHDAESSIEVDTAGRAWSFDAYPNIVKLVSQTYRINLANIFHPYMAISTLLVTPLPHQITAFHAELRRRQPLRYLLADDPRAGKNNILQHKLLSGDVWVSTKQMPKE